MAMTLEQAAFLSNNILQKGVIEKFVYQDPILEKLQFKDIVGNGLTYNVEATEGSADWHGVNETWTEHTIYTAPTTAVTTILGGDADVDKFLLATRSDVNDLRAEQITAKTRAIKHKFMQMFYYGYYYAGAGGDVKGFDGMHYLIRSTTSPYPNVVAVAVTSETPISLSMERLEKAVDLIKVGTPSLIVMSKQMRRSINKYLHGVSGISYQDNVDRRIQTIFGVPVAVSDEVSNDEAADLQYGTNEAGTAVYGHNYADGTALGDDDNGTSIFVLQFAPEACCGLQSGGAIQVEDVGTLETKDALRVRIKWYPSLMFQNILTCSKVTGISPTSTVSA